MCRNCYAKIVKMIINNDYSIRPLENPLRFESDFPYQRFFTLSGMAPINSFSPFADTIDGISKLITTDIKRTRRITQNTFCVSFKLAKIIAYSCVIPSFLS